jgi:hypothetical protein
MKRLPGVVLGVTLLLALVPSVTVQAATANDYEKRVLSEVNAARMARGLVPLRADARLWDLAGYRAGVMASKNVLSHTVAGSLSASLAARGVGWYSYGETIAYTSSSWGTAAADSLVSLWRHSPIHWAMLMSNRYNYVGVGLAYRSSNHRTYGSIVLTESPDHSGARSAVTGATRSGDDVRWTWKGWDLPLQTHTAGLLDFTVQVWRGGGWVTIGTNTTATSATVSNLPPGAWYSLHVRARDRRGNVGPWTAPYRVWVP